MNQSDLDFCQFISTTIKTCLHVLDTIEVHKESANDACLATTRQLTYHDFFINDDQKCVKKLQLGKKNYLLTDLFYLFIFLRPSGNIETIWELITLGIRHIC